ncbi:MAG: extracellular solute-binding protein [Burkholderiales bacterium]|nr:extracellular solute-binding protein [Burkholderiales bacterium]
MTTRRSLLALPLMLALGHAVPAHAQGTVTMYTAMPTEILNALVPAMKAKTGLDIQVVTAGSGELLKRLQAESSRPLADVLISVGADGVDANAKLFTAYDPPGSDKILPGIRTSKMWVPFSVTLPTVIAVNTKLVPENEIPTGWKDLADPKWKGKVAFAGADRSGSAFTQMMQIIHNEGPKEGWELFEKMMANFVITGSSTAVIRGTAQGEYAMSLTLEDNAQRFADGGAPIKIVYPKEGISVSADVMTLVANGPNPAGGKALMDYIASPEGQALIVKASGRRPIRGDVAGPANAVAAASLPVKTYPVEWAVANTKEYMDRYLKLARR